MGRASPVGTVAVDMPAEMSATTTPPCTPVRIVNRVPTPLGISSDTRLFSADNQVSPVIPINAPVLSIPPVFTAPRRVTQDAATVPVITPVIVQPLPASTNSNSSVEPRRSARLQTAKSAIPGSHRSYISTSLPHQVDASLWIPVGKHKKSANSIELLHQSPITNPTEIDFTVPTKQEGEMTRTDAIALFSSSIYKPSSKAYALAAVDQLQPHASTKCTEKTLKQALKPDFLVATHLVNSAVIKHLDMLTIDLGTISLLESENITSDCVRVYGQILVKLKSDGRITARLAAGGNRQPLSSHGETFAPTATESSSNLLLAAYQAFGKDKSIPIHFNTHRRDLFLATRTGLTVRTKSIPF